MCEYPKHERLLNAAEENGINVPNPCLFIAYSLQKLFRTYVAAILMKNALWIYVAAVLMENAFWHILAS